MTAEEARDIIIYTAERLAVPGQEGMLESAREEAMALSDREALVLAAAIESGRLPMCNKEATP